MLSHALAALLKSRRDNNIRFEVEVAEPGYDDGEVHQTDLYDDRVRETHRQDVALEEVLRYDSEADALVLRLGSIFLGDPESKAPPVLTPEEWKMVLKGLDREIRFINVNRMGPVGRDARDRFAQLRNRIRAAL